MSSHREAPEISKDPVADSTDVYAFRSPANPGNVVLIANFIPLQKPDSGPNFFEFGVTWLFDRGPYYLHALVNLLGPVARVTGSGVSPIRNWRSGYRPIRIWSP